MPNETSARAQPRNPLDHDPAKLRRRRVEAGLTATELAARAECSTGHLSELEAGTRNPSPPLLASLARELGCKTADLMPDAEKAAV
jgi:transcriptional regulator with XRE-family HTH domain